MGIGSKQTKITNLESMVGKNVVIIGSGLGGLSAGALLAKDGYHVTLLEQHNIVGGCATTFRRKDFICEVGLHEMDGVYTNPQIKRVFEKLDVYQNIDFLRAPEFFKLSTKSDTFIMPDGLKNAIDALSKKFPKEKESIRKYFNVIEAITKEYGHLENIRWYHYILFPIVFKTVLQYKSLSVSDVFSQLFDNEQLKLILNTNVQYYNDAPDTLSFLLHSLAQYSYYQGGGYFIKGGSGKLSEYLASVIEQNNGKVITRANVMRCTKNSVTYVKKKDEATLRADIIISNLSPQDTYSLFDQKYSEKRKMADSLLTIYIGFSKNLKALYGQRAYSHFIYDDIESVDEFNQMLQRDISQRGFVFVDYSQIDSKLTKTDEKSFGVVCMIDDLEKWQALPDEAYRQKKVDLEQSVIRRLEKYYPDISDFIEYIETGTPKTVQRYIKTPHGTAYGFKPTPQQFFRMPKIKSEKINTLYFVGQWVIAGGFSPAISSGFMCYKKIIESGKIS
jgi:all-trans-retinol 13,14-reductase